MYLRHKDRLTVRTIAHEWAKERRSGDDRLDVTTELLQAFWMGDLGGFRLTPDQRELDRAGVLVGLAADCGDDGHPGIVICHAEDELQGGVTYRADGRAVADIGTRIYLPADPEQWTARIRKKAFRELADLRIEDYARVFREGFNSLSLGKLHFLDFIRRRGLTPPRFWFHPDDPLLHMPDAARREGIGRTPVSEQPARGRKISFDYEQIEDFLDLLRLKEGHAAFKDQTALHERVCRQFGVTKVPKRSQFRRFLSRYCSEHFSLSATRRVAK